MIKTLSCGCYGYNTCECENSNSCKCVPCYCLEKQAAANAVILLKLANIHAEISYFNGHTTKKFYCYLEPYVFSYKRRSRKGALKSVQYSSIDGLKKGIARILEKRRTDGSYLDISSWYNNTCGWYDAQRGIFMKKYDNSTVFCQLLRPEFDQKQ